MPQIKRKMPTRFSYIAYGGPKTGNRSTIAKHLKKMRRDKQAFEAKHPGNRMLTSIRGQRDEVKSRIKAAKRRNIWVRGSK